MAGLSPAIQSKLVQAIKNIQKETGITTVISEQFARPILPLIDYGYVIENGRIVFAGDAQRLKSQKEIQEFYLGRGERESMKSYRDVKQYRHKRRWYG